MDKNSGLTSTVQGNDCLKYVLGEHPPHLPNCEGTTLVSKASDRVHGIRIDVGPSDYAKQVMPMGHEAIIKSRGPTGIYMEKPLLQGRTKETMSQPGTQ